MLMNKKSFLLISLMALSLSACGIKPEHVDPPVGTEKQTFPRTYPDISNDPRPENNGL